MRKPAEPAVEVTPTAIERVDQSRLRIAWSDGQSRVYTAQGLREACPCATCKEKHGPRPEPAPNALPVLSLAEARPTTIDGMRPVGSYAYHIDFSDGHNTGLFTLELLKQLGEEEGAARD